jgi:hypothetical protein
LLFHPVHHGKQLIILKKANNNIIVTGHAIERYRERMFDYESSPEEVVQILREIALKGELVGNRPNTRNNCYEVKYRGVSVVQIREEKRTFVITCLGDKRYRRWVKNKEKCFTKNYVREFMSMKDRHEISF